MVATGAMGTAMLEFVDTGERLLSSRRAVERIKEVPNA